MCKPVSSKPGNSEVYVVCHGFKGVSEEVLEKLLSNTGTEYVNGMWVTYCNLIG